MILTCPVCDRPLGTENVDTHHLVPKIKGGRKLETIKLHVICHRKIHSLWSEWELLHNINNVDTIKENVDMQKFIKWVSNKPINFLDSSKVSNRRRNK